MWTDFLEEGPCGRVVIESWSVDCLLEEGPSGRVARELECGLTCLRRVPVVEWLESWSVD